ncbi:MAG: hypothetical protein LBF68_02115 [Christensenellaceae bacterium]|jgi:hypothetical protein|nr:hypothetical protein [Christensenellaceae bacterium]
MEAKVPFYNIVNIFLPGLVLIGSCVLLFLDEVKTLVDKVTNIGSAGLEVLITVSLFAIAYEVGYIMFRLGSAIVEPILKKTFGWADYNDFIKAGKSSDKAHDKLETLSREYAFARTQVMLFIALAVLTGIRMQWWFMGICVAVAVLFVCTARGHMKRTQKAVTQYLTAPTTETKVATNA